MRRRCAGPPSGCSPSFSSSDFFSFHHHEPHPHDPTDHHAGHQAEAHNHHGAAGRLPGDPAVTSLSWGTAAFGLAIHSLVGGVALASAIAADYADRHAVGPMAWGVFLATIVHKPADALTIVSLMLGAGVPKRTAHLINAGFALMIPLGVVLFTVGLGQLSPATAASCTAVALAFSAGTFLCIALSDLLPELQFHTHDRLKLSIALLSGFCLMAGTSLIEYV